MQAAEIVGIVIGMSMRPSRPTLTVPIIRSSRFEAIAAHAAADVGLPDELQTGSAGNPSPRSIARVPTGPCVGVSASFAFATCTSVLGPAGVDRARRKRQATRRDPVSCGT